MSSETISERFASNRCSGWQAGRCVHGFPGTRFCIGSLDPVKMFEVARPQCCDEEWEDIPMHDEQTRSSPSVERLREALEALRRTFAAAVAPGLSVPGEPAWSIEEHQRASAKQELTNYGDWLRKIEAALSNPVSGTDERALIVAWLRDPETWRMSREQTAEAIERGEHLPALSKETEDVG